MIDAKEKQNISCKLFKGWGPGGERGGEGWESGSDKHTR